MSCPAAYLGLIAASVLRRWGCDSLLCLLGLKIVLISANVKSPTARFSSLEVLLLSMSSSTPLPVGVGYGVVVGIGFFFAFVMCGISYIQVRKQMDGRPYPLCTD